MTNHSRSLARHGDALLADAIRTTEAARAEAKRAAAERVMTKRQAERDRVPLTREQIDGATEIRDRWGWHPVIRVNAVSVTIDAGAWGRETVPFARVLEVRR